MKRSAVLLPLLLASCTSNPYQRSGVETAATQPLRDTRVADDKIPEVLQLAASAPYSMQGMKKCSAIREEIGRLNTALGPDADAPQHKAGDGARIAATATRVAMSTFLPGMGLVRLVTGADKQERRVQEALLAGQIRRSFLKGIGTTKGCKPPAAPTLEAREAVQQLSPPDDDEKDDKQDEKAEKPAD